MPKKTLRPTRLIPGRSRISTEEEKYSPSEDDHHHLHHRRTDTAHADPLPFPAENHSKLHHQEHPRAEPHLFPNMVRVKELQSTINVQPRAP